jgi:hypothetical protein
VQTLSLLSNQNASPNPNQRKKRGGKRNELPKTSYLFLHPSLRHKSVTAHPEQSDPNPEESHKNELKKDSAKKGKYPSHTYIHTLGTYLLHPMLAKPRAKGLQVRRLYAQSW